MCLTVFSPWQLKYNNVLNPEEVYFLVTRVIIAKCGHKGELSAVFSAIYYLKGLKCTIMVLPP